MMRGDSMIIDSQQHREGPKSGPNDFNVFNCYTVNQVAALLKVSKSHIYELISTKQLNAIRLSERRFRVPEQALVAFVYEKSSQMMEYNNVVQPPKRGRKLNVKC